MLFGSAFVTVDTPLALPHVTIWLDTTIRWHVNNNANNCIIAIGSVEYYLHHCKNWGGKNKEIVLDTRVDVIERKWAAFKNPAGL